jgi:beta-lactamase superfamily II metal-dependent hydrolase
MTGNNTNKDFIKVALIGTGGGYGESLVLHIGNNNWIIVDSCIDPHSKRPIPLDYLEQQGVDIANDVKLIICTHWHDDHILGVSKLLEECKTSSLCMASCTDKDKFLLWVAFDNKKGNSEKIVSSSRELFESLKIIKARQGRIINAVQDRVIFRSDENGIKSQLTTLSPSDFVLQEFDKEISTLLSNYSTSEKIVFNTPNEKSVVIQITINDQKIILGSDLEVSNDKRKGWLCILENSQLLERDIKIFKIPHHGSENGFHDRIWSEIISNQPIAGLTPWNRGTKLPKHKMLRKYLEYTDSLYMTVQAKSNKPKARERSISKAIERFNSTLRETKYKKGIITFSYDLSAPENGWDTRLTEGAIQIVEEILNEIEE